MRHVSLSLATMLAAIALAVAAPPAVRWPEVTAPQPMPAAVLTLTADRLFVVESKDPVVILSSPAGLVKVSKESGPLTVFAKFADGQDKLEKRTFAGPHVFLLEPIKSGECELLVIPEKVASDGDILRRPLRVDAGTGPQPPPKPVDPPTPVDPPAPIPEKGFRVLIVYESGELARLPSGQVAALTSAEVRGYLNDKCVAGADAKTKEWRALDKDADLSNESAIWQKAMKRDRKSVPWIVISTGTTGYEGPLPANTADTLALLKKYGG